ncbi:hypothetical protein ACJRO7_031940 [Eucalyptus globulus]|uniref:RING-type E3 ubiquitin transferase n=1 Tax=Eucalyptus globulus TaxID=34317 RepID=A0ABD3JP29_EUCGL
MALELIPIGTILAVLTNQVIKTAQAAKDILVEKDSFRVLSKHLFDIEPVLKELQLQELNDSQAARLALESLETDVKKANSLIEKYKNRSRFYLLVRCRYIVKEVEQVTRDIGRSLAALSLANTEVLTNISDQVNRLQNEMQRVELETSHSQLQIINKLNQGIKDQKRDQGFANDMLEEIARAVGVNVEPSAINEELESFRKEKEEAAHRKEKAEEYFLQQVIALLSRADAAINYEELKTRYFQRFQVIVGYNEREKQIPPLNAFVCPINQTIMVDPVSLCTGTTAERAAINAWLECGERTDPVTGEVLQDTSLRSNLPLRQSIEEWRELNYCLRIRCCKSNMSSGSDELVKEALCQIQELVREDSVNKDWIFIGGLTDIIVSILGNSHNKDVKRKILITLKEVVEGHAKSKEQLVESKGWDYIIPCLGRDPSISKEAIALLFELLQDRSGWNVSACEKLSQQCSAILFLVTLLRGPETESAEYAKKILDKLLDADEGNITCAARSGWYNPLVDRIVQGPQSLRMSMVRSLVNMELIEANVEIIGKMGVTPPLLEMLSGTAESKELSLRALVKLSSCGANKELLAASDGVSHIMKLMFMSHERPAIIIKCCELLEKLTSDGDGIKFLVDGRGTQLELEPIITSMLDFQQSASSSHVRRPALRVILAICNSEPELVKKAVLAANGISIVLPLIDDSASEIREVAINLLFLFSQHEPQGVVEYLLKPRRLEALVGFLENEDKCDVQMAAAGLLANLPKSEVSLTTRLIELDGVEAIVKVLRSGTMEAKENALSALFRFTDPANVESQRIVVEQGVYPLLVNFLRVGSVTAKARAAALIGNLSSSTPRLVMSTKPSFCWCFSAHVPRCPAHGSKCSVASTFCLLEANALPELVNLLQIQVHATAYEAIQALSTLVREVSPNRGANVLHEANAIKPILEILTWGMDSLKEEALGFLEKIFQSKDIMERYGSTAKLLLVRMAGRNIRDESHIGRKAAHVLSLLERYSKSSTSIIPGIYG